MKSDEDKLQAAAKSGEAVANPLGDDRFKKLFSNADYEIDFDSDVYKHHHPQPNQKRRQVSDLLQEKFSAVQEDEAEDDSSAAESSEEEDLLETVTGRRLAPPPKRERRRDEGKKAKGKKKGGEGDGPQMFEMKEGEELRPLVPLDEQTSQTKRSKGRNFAALVKEREAAGGKERVQRGTAGAKTIVFKVRELWGEG